MQNELVSIIIPVYQSAKYLERTVLSVLAQTYRPIEILLIDDGSTDSGKEICDKLAKQNKEVSVFHKEHRGVSAARNYGIQKAKGKYIQFVDADDEVLPGMIVKLVQAIQSSGAYVAVCGYEIIEKSRIKKECILELHNTARIFEKRNVYEIIKNNLLSVVWNKLYVRENIRHFFNEELVLCEDSVFATQYFRDNPRMVYCSEILYRYHQNSDHCRVKGRRVLGYTGIKAYYLNNLKLIKEITNKTKRTDALQHIRKVFFYGVYTYIFEALPYSGLRRDEAVALAESVMRDKVYIKNIYGLKKLYFKEKCYRFASKVQSGRLLYFLICCRKGLLRKG